MNILLFLAPKSKVEYVYDYFSIRQVLEKMSYHKYSAIPMLNKEGKYVGTITEGDLLWYIKDQSDYNIKKAELDPIKNVKRKMSIDPIKSTENIENVLKVAINQNFIPVEDDNGTFIGIIKRKDVIQYCSEQLFKK